MRPACWQTPRCLYNSSLLAEEAPTRRPNLQEGQRQTNRTCRGTSVCREIKMREVTPHTDTHAKWNQQTSYWQRWAFLFSYSSKLSCRGSHLRSAIVCRRSPTCGLHVDRLISCITQLLPPSAADSLNNSLDLVRRCKNWFMLLPAFFLPLPTSSLQFSTRQALMLDNLG